jgi:hypothetical protein
MPTVSTLTVEVDTKTDKMKSGLKSARIALAGLGAAAVVTFKAFEDSQKVSAQTDAVIKSTGASANVTAQQVQDLASSLSEKSGIDDEVIQSGENMLLTFTNIRNEVGKGNDIFNQAQIAATDMAAGMAAASGSSVDLKGASIQLGKALNDPVAGITALTRVGVFFDEQTKKRITSLVKQGKTMEAQKIILAEVSKEFGGSAEANKTASASAAVAFGNLEEAIGGVVAGGLTPLLSAAQPVIDFLTRFPGLTAGVIAGIVGIYVGIKAYSAAMQVAAIIQKLMLVTSPWLLLAAAVIVLTVLIVKNWATIKKVVLRVWDAIKKSAPFKIIAAIVTTYVKVMVAEIKVVLAVAKVVWNAIKTVAVGAWKVISGVFKIEIGIIKTVFDNVKRALITGWQAIRDVGKGIWSVISGAAIAVFNAIAGAWNSTVGSLSFHIPGWVPKLGGAGFDVPDIPTLATGGVVGRTGLAVVHEGERFSGVGNDRGSTRKMVLNLDRKRFLDVMAYDATYGDGF